jgi:selenocysteine lyase/cysteine desulfurase
MDPDTGTLDPADLEAALEGARIVAIGAASNALGTMPDVASTTRLAKEAGATVFVDAVHYAPHALVDVAALGADFLAVSPYKFYGPHLGVLWGRKERIQTLDLPRVASAPDTAPERIETGTASFEAIAGAAAAVDFLASLGGESGPDGDVSASGNIASDADAPGDRRARLQRAYGALHERGEALFRRLWNGLGDVPVVRPFGPPPSGRRTPTLGFAVDGHPAGEVADALGKRGLFVTHGDFYATTVIQRLGYGGRGILRAGCVAYTTEEEVDRLVEAISELA